MRPFLTNKEIISGNKISFFEGEKSVSNESIVEEILNVSYINVAEISPGIRSRKYKPVKSYRYCC